MKKAYVLLWLSLFAVALLIGNLFVGSTAVAPSDVIAALHGTADSTATFIVGETRMPQAVTALLAGRLADADSFCQPFGRPFDPRAQRWR